MKLPIDVAIVLSTISSLACAIPLAAGPASGVEDEQKFHLKTEPAPDSNLAKRSKGQFVYPRTNGAHTFSPCLFYEPVDFGVFSITRDTKLRVNARQKHPHYVMLNPTNNARVWEEISIVPEKSKGTRGFAINKNGILTNAAAPSFKACDWNLLAKELFYENPNSFHNFTVLPQPSSCDQVILKAVPVK